MKVHFVCLGNVFRSRFAEAYARSISTKYEFSSSGLVASSSQPYGPISWWGAKVAYDHEIGPHLAESWQKTTQELLDSNDLVIFMHGNVKARALETYDLDDVQHVSWSVGDVYHVGQKDKAEIQEMLTVIEARAQEIMSNVDALMNELETRTI